MIDQGERIRTHFLDAPKPRLKAGRATVQMARHTSRGVVGCQLAIEVPQAELPPSNAVTKSADGTAKIFIGCLDIALHPIKSQDDLG